MGEDVGEGVWRVAKCGEKGSAVELMDLSSGASEPPSGVSGLQKEVRAEHWQRNGSKPKQTESHPPNKVQILFI